MTMLPRPDERADHLRAARNLKMARSAHAYVRGSTVKFYEWLERSEATLPDGPPVWICGDCHVGNLGPLADMKGRVAMQIRDLDQTVVGNPAHDLVRLGLSLASAARGYDLAGVTTVRLVERLVAGYAHGLQAPTEDLRRADRAPKPVRRLLALSSGRRWRHLAAERLATVRPTIPLGRRFWEVAQVERDAIDELVGLPEVHERIVQLQGKKRDAAVHVVDVAYWMKGCSSLGRLRYAVMLELRDDDDRSLCLLDVKEAVAAAAPRAGDASMPRDNAIRVVTGARALSPHLGERMVAGRMLDRGVVIRELMPQDLKLDIERVGEEDILGLAHYAASVVGLAHRRQMDDADLALWSAEMLRSTSRTLDAPSWLWSSIVELLGIHESAYLQHCRLYALRDAA